MPEVLYYILITVSLVSLIYNLKNLPDEFRLFIPLLLLSLTVEGTRFILPDRHSLSIFLFSIYTPVEYVLISLIIISFLSSVRKRKIIWISIPFFIFFSFYAQFGIKNSGVFYRYLDVLIESPLIFTWTLFYFFQLFSDEVNFYFRSNPRFWISAGNLLFFSGSFFSYGFGAYLHNTNRSNLAETVFWIERILNIFLYIFYIIGFLCVGKKKSLSW